MASTERMTLVIGIESTAHTFGIAILRDKEVLANVRKNFTTEKGGMIPAKVGLHHEEAYPQALAEALSTANVTLQDIELIAFSDSPGLGHCLRVGAGVARSLALLLHIPLVGVNHCIAHLEVATLATEAKDPVLLYCSGANTQVIAYDEGKYRIFGETLDTGIGNFLDTFARDLGYGFPGGPKIEALANAASADGRIPQLLPIPYTVKGMDVGFSGLQTYLLQRIKEGVDERDLAYSVQETVFAMLVEVAERAMAHIGKNELALGGGVACNKRLQEMCRLMCESRNAKSFCPANQFLVDNAAMIAWTGLVMHAKGGAQILVEESPIKPYERTDDVAVTWR